MEFDPDKPQTELQVGSKLKRTLKIAGGGIMALAFVLSPSYMAEYYVRSKIQEVYDANAERNALLAAACFKNIPTAPGLELKDKADCASLYQTPEWAVERYGLYRPNALSAEVFPSISHCDKFVAVTPPRSENSMVIVPVLGSKDPTWLVHSKSFPSGEFDVLPIKNTFINIELRADLANLIEATKQSSDCIQKVLVSTTTTEDPQED